MMTLKERWNRHANGSRIIALYYLDHVFCFFQFEFFLRDDPNQAIPRQSQHLVNFEFKATGFFFSSVRVDDDDDDMGLLILQPTSSTGTDKEGKLWQPSQEMMGTSLHKPPDFCRRPANDGKIRE
jgi:hypothetical protein